MRKILLLLLLVSFGAQAQNRFFLKGKSVSFSTGAEEIFSNVVTDQTGSTISVTFDVDRPEEPAKPVVERVTVSGTAIDGGTLTASYSGYYSASGYSDASTWQWYRADNPQSTGSVIGGATSSTYNPVQADVSKYIRAVLIPTDAVGTVGDAVTSVFTGQIADDEFNPVTDIPWYIAHLPADYSTGLWIDRGTTGGTNNSVQNGSDNVPTDIADGADFESSNNEELVLDQPSPQLSMPVEIWTRVKLESYNSSWAYLVAFNGSQYLQQRTGGVLYVSGVSTGYTLPLNQWVVIRVVISGVANTSEVYVNNVLISSTINASTTAFGTSNGRFGSNAGGTANRADMVQSHWFIKSGKTTAPQATNMWTWFSTYFPWS